MTGVASKFVPTSLTKKFLKPFGAINKKIHVATGKLQQMGGVVKIKRGSTPAPSYKDMSSAEKFTP
ncbi:MAG: hypothetical protein KKE05_02220 [Nanoarchaeota archaeon]|nr:hypothetical protein [Nanoarchaeota archaeon]